MDRLITLESQYSYSKRITRNHIMFSKQTRCLSLKFIVPQRASYPGFMSEFQHKKILKGKKGIYTDVGGRNIIFKVTL